MRTHTQCTSRYLTKLKYSSKLHAWYSNYNDDGIWQPDVILYLEEVDSVFEKIRRTGGLNRAKVTALRTACRKMNITYKGKSDANMRTSIRDAYTSYIHRHEAN